MLNTTKTPKDSTNCSNSAIDLCRSVPKLRTNDNYRPRSAFYNESRILDFDEHRKKKERFRMNKLHWEQIPRANNPSKPLQEKAVNLLAVIVHKLQKMEVVTLNHNYLSRITKCGKDQNVNLLRQLDDVLDISFHAKFTIGKTIHRNCYVIQHTEKGRATIENPEVLLTQKHFVGNIAVSSIEKTSTEDKKDTSCAEFFPSFSIYKEEVLENRSNKSNFYKNSFEEEKILQSPMASICNKTEESRVVTANQINHTFAKDASKRKPQIFPKIFKAKELKEFYPLTKDDCKILQSTSGREFSLNAMNEILLDMSKRITNRLFNSKKGFLSYMSKVFSYEMRDAVKINNENFKIRNNQSKEEQDARHHEEYLTKIEYSLEVSPEWHFKKRLATVLPRNKAYNLLKSFNKLEIERGGICRIILNQSVELTGHDKQIILTEVKATHNGVGRNISIERIEFDILKKTKSYTSSTSTTLQEELGIWGRVRQRLISIYGEATDRNWFSKLEAVEDVEKNEVKLKAPNNFIKDWISQNYFEAIENVIGREKCKVEFC